MLNFLKNYSGVELLIVLIAYILAVLCAIVLHELAHGLMAQRCGDDTPRLSGRLTLNPAKHLDLLGTVCLLLFGFGWAKPVPVNINNFKERKKGLFLVSIAGVTTNLIIAFFAIAFSVGLAFISVNFMEAMLASSILYYVIMFFSNFFQYLAIINIALMIFNLFPIYPLDGFNIVTSLSSYSNKFVLHMQRYSLIYSIILIFSCDWFLSPAVNWIYEKFLSFWFLVV